MSGNRDELPERTGGNTEGSSRSRQQESQEAIAERLGIDPEQVTTRDTLDRGVEQRLTEEGRQAAERSAAQRVAEQAGFIERDDVRANVDPETFAVEQRLTEEGTSEAERRLAEETAADQEFVRPSDLQADVDPETFAAEATLTESGRQNVQQRQAEQLRQQAAQQSDRFGAGDFAVDRSGKEISVEPTEAAVDRERSEQIEQLRQEAAQQSDRFGAGDFTVDRSGGQISVEATEEAINREQREQAAQQIDQQITGVDIDSGDIRSDGDGFIPRDSVLRAAAAEQTGDFRQTRVPFNEVASTIEANGGDIADLTQLRDDVSGGKIKIADVGPVARGIDGFSITDLERLANQGETETISTDPSDFRVSAGDSGSREVEFTEQAVQARAAAGFDTQLSGIDVGVEDVEPVDSGGFGLDDATQQQLSDQQRQEFADALESGEAFESGEAPEGLGDVDPQTDVAVEDGQLTLADDTQAELVESQIRSQVGATPGLNTDNVLERAVSQDEILQAAEEQIENQTGTDVPGWLIEDANLNVNANGTISANRVLLNSRQFHDDFRDVSTLRLNTDLLDGADLSVDATEAFSGQVEQSIAEQISDRNVVDVSPDEIDISGGSVDVPTPESLTIENDQITADGLTESGQSDFARRQLQSIQTTEGVSVDTPVNSQPFANVSADLAQAADGGGSLSSATRIVAASDTVSNIGDLDDLPDARIIEGLEPEQAEERLGIDSSTVREAQSDIQQRRQQLESDPSAVLESIASNQDEFVEDSTRIGVAGERGQRIRQSAREQINQLEQSIAAGDDDVDAQDVGLSLTDDLSGIRSIDQEGRQAIAQSVDEQLPNFGAEEINVGVSGGQITTSIEDSVRERFVQNAQRVEEIQVRNEIADETEGIGRRDIEVDAGEGVSPSDELVTETLGTDVNGDIESFDQLEAAANIQARQQARQQAIQQVDSQTIGAIDPRNVSVERTETGFEANVSGAAAESVDLSAVDVGQTTTTQVNATNATGPIDLEASNQVAAGINEAGGDINDAIAGATGVNVAAAVENATGRDLGLNTDRSVERVRGEQFGDFDFSLGLGDPEEDEVENFLDDVSGGIRDTSENVGENLFDGGVSPVTEGLEAAGRDDLAAQYDATIRDVGEGIVTGAGGLAASAPQLATEAPEFAGFAVTNPGTTVDRLQTEVPRRASLLGESAASNPAQFSGELIGSLGASRAAFKLTQGTRAEFATRAAVQPGEEVLRAAGRRGITGTRRLSDAIGDTDFAGSTRGQADLTGLSRGETSSETDTSVDLDSLPDEIGGTRQFSETDIQAGTRRTPSQRIDTDRSSSLSAQARARLEDDSGIPEVDSPLGDLRQFDSQQRSVAETDLRQRLDTDSRSVTDVVTGSEAATDTVTTDQQTPEVNFDSDVGGVEGGVEVTETVETDVAGVDSQFRQDIGETGQRRFFERGRSDIEVGEDIETRLGVDAGSNLRPEVGVDQRTEVGSQLDARTGVDTTAGVDPRSEIDARTGLESDTELRSEIDNRFETDTRLEGETRIETTRRPETRIETETEIRTETRTEPDVDIFGDEDSDDEPPLFGTESSDDIFDSGILSGREALQSSFGR